jgi:aspartyl-tRNA(Asn)/glutamyl-tRNA(Gln) amidotransferase subunit B
MKYQPTIGLEIHVQLKTKAKMFCGCLNNPEEKQPNLNVCPICMGHPGTLPVINQQAVKNVIKTGLALNCKISEKSWFERKNYFYPDLPKGYQISQNEMPLCKNGKLVIDSRDIKINNIHLEEDTGRLIHSEDNDSSLVDFNRAGIPLMELATEPDIQSAAEAREFCEELRLISRYLGISNADMEKGEMRCEANISLSKKEKELGTKVEIKNLNSFKAVERAIDYEIKRQTELLESGEKIIHETRGWNDNKQKTFSQRTKEFAEDYRYFPEPDLPPLKISKKDIEKIKAEIPELPANRRIRFEKEYKLSENDIEIFTNYKTLGDYFEKVVSELGRWDYKLIKLSANYLITELKKYLPTLEDIESLKITPENFAELIAIIEQGKISSSAAQAVLKEMLEAGADPSNIIEEKNLSQVSDESELKKIIEKVIKDNPGPIKDYRVGKAEALQFLIGQVMRQSKGRANPQIAAKLLKNALT